MALSTESLYLTRYEVDRMIEKEDAETNSIPVSDLNTLRLIARAVGSRTYKERFLGISFWACDYGEKHLFTRSGEVG